MGKMKKLVLATGFLLVAFATSAYAWWFYGYAPVKSCYDSDGGFNLSANGRVWGQTLNDTNYTFTDFCVDSSVIAEYLCVYDHPSNYTYVAALGENCSTYNLTCSGGKCVY
jgi:hypothetical protein